jgi:glycosyltransferase involved in cell wall biosynthesis
MKIAFVCGPTSSMIRPSYLGRELARRGHDIHVIVPPSPKPPEFFGLEDHPVAIDRCPPGGRPWTEVTARLRALDPDVVHCVETGRRTLPPTLRYAPRSRAVSIVDMPDRMSGWDRLLSKFTVAFEYWALWQADAVAVASQALLEHYQRRRHRARLYYLPFAVDLDFFERQRDRAAQIRARYGDLKLLTYLGYLIHQYSPMESLAMARALARRRRDFRLLYAGRGPYLPALQAQAEAWGLTDLVDFVGYVPEEELPGYLTASDVLLCPLEDNAANRFRCPSKAFWYLAARRPIVATKMGEVYHALGEESLYYQYGNAEDFADQVEVALSGAAPLPSEARVARHSWPAVADRYEQMLAELREGQGRADGESAS